jgi:hypothetical protein
MYDSLHVAISASWLLLVMSVPTTMTAPIGSCSNRSVQYAELRTSWKSENRGLSLAVDDRAGASEAPLAEEFDLLRAIDYFSSEASTQAEAAWADLSNRIDALLSPDEPHESADRISRLNRRRLPGAAFGPRAATSGSIAWRVRG